MAAMKHVVLVALTSFAVVVAWEVTPGAQQREKADWLTDGGDPQRTTWQRNETILTKASVKDMKLLWKIKLDNEPQMHNHLPDLPALPALPAPSAVSR